MTDQEHTVRLHYHPMLMRGALEKNTDAPWETLDFDPDDVPVTYHYGADDIDEILERENTMDMHFLEHTLASTGVRPVGDTELQETEQ